MLVAITQLHDGETERALTLLDQLYATSGDDTELKANLSFFKGQCYAIRGDEKRAKSEYAKALKTDNYELKQTAQVNNAKADEISEMYREDPLMAAKRLEFIRVHRTLEEKINNAIRKTKIGKTVDNTVRKLKGLLK